MKESKVKPIHRLSINSTSMLLMFLAQNFVTSESARAYSLEDINDKEILINDSIQLTKDGKYRNVSFKIGSLNVTLDCNGATLERSQVSFQIVDLPKLLNRRGEPPTKDILTQLAQEPQTAKRIREALLANLIKNVIIKNCTFLNSRFPPLQIDNRSLSLTVRNLGLGMTDDDMRMISPTNIHIKTSRSKEIRLISMWRERVESMSARTRKT